MFKKDTSVFGIYATRAGVENAVNTLKVAEYDSANISVLFPFNKDAPHEKETRSPEGPAVTAATGAVAGAVLGSIVGIGLLGIPGVGPFLAAGPVVAALSFAGAASAFSGIAGGLIAMGISEVEAKKYEGKIRKNGILLSVHNLDTISNGRAREILRVTGAEDITTTAMTVEPLVEIPINKGVPLENAAIVNGQPSDTLPENSQLPSSITDIKPFETQKAAEYISPSQPLDLLGHLSNVAAVIL